MLERDSLEGSSFLDIGSGVGLFSLAARRLGARVYSFDYDPLSVACTAELRRRYFPEDADWVVEEGSVLDQELMRSLDEFDVVYSWGVLHHTGAMWEALANAAIPVAKGGKLFIALYNDQGATSRRWEKVKRVYCSSVLGRILVTAVFVPYFLLGTLVADIGRGRRPLSRFKEVRGMSAVTSWMDWLGGYPFEVAKPEQVLDFLRARGYRLERLKTCGGKLGNNQFVFVRE